MFWSQQDAVQLQQLLSEPGHVKLNILVLSRDAHHLWGQSQFALRPVGEPNPDKLQLQFLWLNPDQSNATILDYQQGKHTMLIHGNHPDPGFARLIKSGDIVQLTTCDASKYPLPDRRLLELQWHLNRATRAMANADVLRLIFRDEDSEGIRALENGADDGLEDDPDHSVITHTPHLSEYLIDCALEQGIIQYDHVPRWRRRLMRWSEGEGSSSQASASST